MIRLTCALLGWLIGYLIWDFGFDQDADDWAQIFSRMTLAERLDYFFLRYDFFILPMVGALIGLMYSGTIKRLLAEADDDRG